MCKISVIIPIYNVDKYLDDCMDSLVTQTIGFENLEVILVDDCSTDDSSVIMQKYEERYSNVKCIYLKENSGAAGKPRNEGIKEAHADYIMFLDPDDKYYPEACKVLFDKIADTECDLVSGYYSTFDSEKGILEENALMAQNVKENIYNMPVDMGKIIKFRCSFAAKIYKKSIIDKYSICFAEKIIGQDSVFFVEYLFHSFRVYYIQMPILQYRQRKQKDKSVSYDLSKKHFCDIAIAMQIIKELFVRNDMEEKLNMFFEGVVEYYIRQIVDSDLDETEICDILKQWEWLFEYTGECKEELIYSNIILTGYCKGDFTNLAKMLVSMRPIKRYMEETEKARDWWKQQSDNKDKEIEEIEKARNWWKQQSDNKDRGIEETEKARDWWKQQSNNFEKQVLELNNWISKLEEAKEYFQGEIRKRDEEIEQLKGLL